TVAPGRSPGVGGGIVAAAVVEIHLVLAPAPDDHLGAGPDRRVVQAPLRSGGARGGRPAIGDRIVAPAAGEVRLRVRGGRVGPTPDDHLAAGPDRGMTGAGGRSVQKRSRGPAVGRRVITPPRIAPSDAPPDDHVHAGPDGGVIEPRRRPAVDVRRGPG